VHSVHAHNYVLHFHILLYERVHHRQGNLQRNIRMQFRIFYLIIKRNFLCGDRRRAKILEE